MKSYANFVYLRNLLASCPDENSVVIGVYNRIFKPRVKIVAEDCQTKIGTPRPVNNRAVGYLQIDNSDLPIIPSQVTALLNSNVRTTYVRSVESCHASITYPDGRVENGICRKCLHGSYEYIDPDFDRITIQNVVDYPLLATVPAVGQLVAFDFTGEESLKFLTYLSSTYSGNILGIRSYLQTPLPLREGLLVSFLPDQIVALFTREVTDTKTVSQLELNYANSISFKLEKVLFLLTQYILGYYSK